MTTDVGKFTITVPEGHPEAGKKIAKTFEFKVCADTAEAEAVIEDKDWSILDMVNERQKGAARSNAYQNALMPYKPSEVSSDDIKARMIRDAIRAGHTEESATTLIESLFSAV